MTRSPEGSSEYHEMSEGARLLHELERSGEYVFHGSPDGDIAELEPRQATNIVDGVNQEDGPPGIATTPNADFAIFHALAKNRGEGSYRFGTHPDGTRFMEASQSVLDAIKGQTAHVYVFPKSSFAPRFGNDQEMERRSEDKQKPVQVVAVTDHDLPSDITLIS